MAVGDFALSGMQEAAELEEGEISQEDKLAKRRKELLDAQNERKVSLPIPCPQNCSSLHHSQFDGASCIQA